MKTHSAQQRPKKPKEIYKEYYKAGDMPVPRELLPDRLPYMKEGWRIDAMEVRTMGALDDGREFQDVRIYCKETVW